MPHVNVLMATYNGARYLRQQLDSILAQEGVDVSLTVRDDGSTDTTPAIFDEYRERCNLRILHDTDHLGPARGFMRLLAQCADADLYAFADQDDYWLPDKLAAAAEKLQTAGDSPALYFSPTHIADADLAPVAVQDIRPLLTFGESLVAEFVSGCTMVMNHALRRLLLSYTPTYLPMHDVWAYSVAQAVGAHIAFDPTPHILYRQHAANAVGATGSALGEWRKRLQRLRAGGGSRSARAAEIERGFADRMPADRRNLLHRFVRAKHSFPLRLSLLREPGLRCGDAHTYRHFRLALLANTY
ncbi:MAG: glycosyltransferase family 2 protein [Bacteroidaceae bacterium]|nr:glycosyltransferase family 2 protein [Bacteroidaceae bacterium]